MKTQRTDLSQVAMYVSIDELLLINNALNEVCNGLHFSDGGFQTRLGLQRTEAEELRSQIHQLYVDARAPE